MITSILIIAGPGKIGLSASKVSIIIDKKRCLLRNIIDKNACLCALDDFLREGGLPESLQYMYKREYISSVFQIGNLVRLSKNMHGIKHLLVVTRDPEQTTRTIDDCRVEMIPAEQLYLSVSQLAVK